MRMTVDETKVYKEACNLNAGDGEAIVRHYRSTQKVTRFRLLEPHLPEHVANAETTTGGCHRACRLTQKPPHPQPFLAKSPEASAAAYVEGSSNKVSILA